MNNDPKQGQKPGIGGLSPLLQIRSVSDIFDANPRCGRSSPKKPAWTARLAANRSHARAWLPIRGRCFCGSAPSSQTMLRRLGRSLALPIGGTFFSAGRLPVEARPVAVWSRSLSDRWLPGALCPRPGHSAHSMAKPGRVAIQADPNPAAGVERRDRADQEAGDFHIFERSINRLLAELTAERAQDEGGRKP